MQHCFAPPDLLSRQETQSRRLSWSSHGQRIRRVNRFPGIPQKEEWTMPNHRILLSVDEVMVLKRIAHTLAPQVGYTKGCDAYRRIVARLMGVPEAPPEPVLQYPPRCHTQRRT